MNEEAVRKIESSEPEITYSVKELLKSIDDRLAKIEVQTIKSKINIRIMWLAIGGIIAAITGMHFYL